jgi:hypothetical protein
MLYIVAQIGSSTAAIADSYSKGSTVNWKSVYFIRHNGIACHAPADRFGLIESLVAATLCVWC